LAASPGRSLYTSPVPLDSASKLTVETPEQIGIDFELAGLGSRLLAALIDFLCMSVFIAVAIGLALGAAGGEADSWRRVAENATGQEPWTRGLGVAATILVLLAIFVVQWGYYIICEMTMDGASPGKRALGLRVIRDNGLPVGFVQSMVRNLVRVVDFLPWAYGVGLVATFASGRSQRLGDLAAGTLVIKLGSHPLAQLEPPPGPPPGSDVLRPEERELVHRFFARSGKMLPEARRALASEIAAPLAQRRGLKLPREDTLDDESWLFSLARRENNEDPPR
jgi:uncharacterized RDD family membrane protein YckC